MSTEPGSLNVAFQRVGRGLLGTWCVIGPIFLVFAYGELQLPPYLFLLALVGVFYVIAIWKWRQKGAAFIRTVVIDVLLTLLFAGVGGAIGGLIAAFGGPRLYENGTLTLVYALVGFWILEARKRRVA